MIPRAFTLTAVALLVTTAASVPAGDRRPAPPAPRDSVVIPASISEEHLELMAGLVNAAAERGPVGQAARDLNALLQPHFDREEQIALPPLGLLRPLLDGGLPAGAEQVLPLTDSLRAELPRMLAEHRLIAAAVDHFEQVARAENVYRYEMLAVSLRRHARTEEEVLYPAAILVGELVRARTAEYARRR